MQRSWRSRSLSRFTHPRTPVDLLVAAWIYRGIRVTGYPGRRNLVKQLEGCRHDVTEIN